ncbi:MAG: SRPBCC family protein [Salibacteraceae bacterium]
MKVLKITGIILVVLIVLIAVLSFIAPTHVKLERSKFIDAPREFVWQFVDDFESRNQWSPWMQLDPNMTTNLEGEDGTAGAKFTWSGNDDVGKGEQTIISIDPGNSIVTHIRFIEPWEGEAESAITLVDTNGGTLVTWSFESEYPRPMNAMLLFMDIDEMVGGDYDKGLETLSQIINSAKSSRNQFGNYTIERTEMRPKTYIGVKRTVSFNDLGNFFAQNYGSIYQAVGKSGVQMAGMPSAVYFSYDEANAVTEVMAAVPVAQEVAIKGFENYTWPGGTVLVTDHFGSYESIGNAHKAMDEYIKWHSLSQNGPVIEEYMNDPQTVADPSDIHTRIYYSVD